MPNLLIATGIFHPQSGGPATYLWHLLPRLQEHGYNVHVLTYGDPSVPDDYPYPVTRVPRGNLVQQTWAYWRAAGDLLPWADAIYAHSALVPLPRTDKPRVIKIVGDQAWERAVGRRWVHPLTDIDHFQVMRSNHPGVRVLRRLRTLAARRATGVIVPSEYLRRMVTGWGVMSSRVRVIYNALPPDETTNALSQAAARAQLGLDAERPLLLTVARLTYWKGVDDFIVTIRGLPDVQLIVIGDGDLRADLEDFAVQQEVADRVTFLGRVPREQVALYMKAADYTGLYSGYEGLPHVLLESLHAGTPVIASRKGGNLEVVRHDVNGLLAQWDDVPALEAATQTAFSPGKRDELAANAHVGMERFDHERMVQQTVDALNTFLRVG